MAEDENKRGDDDGEDREIVYYYSRERRLEKASQRVRDLNEGTQVITGLNRRNAGTRGRGNIILMSLLFIICFMMLIMSRTDSPGSLKLGENDVNISLQRNKDGALSLTVKKKIPKNSVPYTGLVDIGIGPIRKIVPENQADAAPEMIIERIFFDFSEDQIFNIPLPFDGEEFLVILESEQERIRQRLKAPK